MLNNQKFFLDVLTLEDKDTAASKHWDVTAHWCSVMSLKNRITQWHCCEWPKQIWLNF